MDDDHPNDEQDWRDFDEDDLDMLIGMLRITVDLIDLGNHRAGGRRGHTRRGGMAQ